MLFMKRYTTGAIVLDEEDRITQLKQMDPDLNGVVDGVDREVTLGRGALFGGRRGRGPQRGEATLWPEHHVLDISARQTPRRGFAIF